MTVKVPDVRVSGNRGKNAGIKNFLDISFFREKIGSLVLGILKIIQHTKGKLEKSLDFPSMFAHPSLVE